MGNVPLRVALVDISPLAVKMVREILESAPEIEIVGVARNKTEALHLVTNQHPQVLCVAANLSGSGSLELVREVMADFPVPILVMGERPGSSEDASRDAQLTVTLLGAGAVDKWSKPNGIPQKGDAQSAELITKIRRLSRVPVISRPLRRNPGAPSADGSAVARPRAATRATALSTPSASRVLAVGASTGGPQALLNLFAALPRDFPWPILCVQHISKGFLPEMLTWLDSQCNLTIQLAQEGEAALPGYVYFPAEDHHLEIDTRGHLHLSQGPRRDGHRPSVTTTFESVARIYGDHAIAVLLTGMGSDGAVGIKAVHDAGGTTFAQDEASCIVFGMPKQAIELGAVQYVLPPAEIAKKLLSLIR